MHLVNKEQSVWRNEKKTCTVYKLRANVQKIWISVKETKFNLNKTFVSNIDVYTLFCSSELKYYFYTFNLHFSRNLCINVSSLIYLKPHRRFWDPQRSAKVWRVSSWRPARRLQRVGGEPRAVCLRRRSVGGLRSRHLLHLLPSHHLIITLSTVTKRRLHWNVQRSRWGICSDHVFFLNYFLLQRN